MAFAQAANLAEKALPHEQRPITDNISNFSADDYGDHSQMMKALIWQGKYSVKISMSPITRLNEYSSDTWNS